MKKLLSILTLLLVTWVPSVGFAQTRPNILFIAVDDLRPAIGCYGDSLAITPNIDRLASDGLLFNQAYCQVAVCNPSRASLMTGQRPDKLGVWTLPIHFREAKPDAITMPQWFREFGYTAVSHGKIYHNPTPDPQSWSEPIRKLPPLPSPYPDGTWAIVKAAKKELPKNDWRKTSLRRPRTAAPDLPDNKLLDGARTDRMIEWREFKTGELVVRELYDHQTDYSETTNLIDTAPESLVEELARLLSTTHPPVPLELVPEIHSETSEEKGEITFQNDSDSVLLVSKVKRSGKRERPKEIALGKSLNIDGSVGRVFVVESSDGDTYEVHWISETKQTVVIE